MAEKRPAPSPSPSPADEGGLEGRVMKKGRSMKEVAGMVLVLDSMRKMRGGKPPTDVEKEMMKEARESLAEMCLKFAPKDVFPVDGFGGLIEQLGLDKVKEQSIGIRKPPTLSISDKLMAAKSKMEKMQEFSVPSASNSSQRSQTAMGTSTKRHNASHIKTFPQSSTAVNSSGSLQPASPMGRGTPVSSASLPYQLPTSEVQPLITGVVVSGNLVRDSSSVAPPRVGRPHFQRDGLKIGSSQALQVQATTANHSTVRTPTWSVLPASVSTARLGADNKVTQVTMAAQVTRPKPFVPRRASRNSPSTYPHLQGTSFIRATPALRKTHSEIGKIVQKFIQPVLHAMTMPSYDYLSEALTCQMCNSTINEVSNVLVCDGCEKGYHLKCLQRSPESVSLEQWNLKCLQRSPETVHHEQWNCRKCLSITNGKPLPPKYGRVLQSINSSKMPTVAAVVQSSHRKAFGPDEKVCQSKITRNGNVALQNSTTNGMENSLNHLPSASKMDNNQRMEGTGNVSGKENVEGKVSSATCSSNLTSGICSNNLTVSTNDNSFFPAHLMISFEEKVVEVKSQPPAKPETVYISFDHSQFLNHLQSSGHSQLANSVGIPSQQVPLSLSMVSDAKDSSARAGLANSSSNEYRRETQGVGQSNLAETPIARNGDAECVSTTSDSFHTVDWIGDMLQVAEEKHYYQSCRHNGFIYNVLEYAVIRFENEKLIPSKILAMWEDIKAGKKCVTVNRCYFPGDLPQALGRPCSLESNEVYLSNCSSTVMAGQIQGPCKVLPPSKFNEERERISHLEASPIGGLQPLYLCKWIYDESKGVFRDVSC